MFKFFLGKCDILPIRLFSGFGLKQLNIKKLTMVTMDLCAFVPLLPAPPLRGLNLFDAHFQLLSYICTSIIMQTPKSTENLKKRAKSTETQNKNQL